VSNRIHPTAVLGPQVELGSGNVIGPYTVLQGPLVLGDDNYVAPFVCLGGLAEVKGHDFAPAWEEPYAGQPAIVGSRNVFKEHVTVSGGWAHETVVGDDNILMSKAHVNHDCRVGSGVTLAAMAVLAGHVRVGDGANIGLGATVHQRRVVPAGAMIGMQAAVTADLPPYVVSMGVPARPVRLNTLRLDRMGVSPDHHTALAAVLLDGSRDLTGVPDDLLPDVRAWLDTSGGAS
jgi:UDP-N-acetylglucosamine acyltransferase